MDPDELRATLTAGIAAIRQGNRVRGREMLLRVVAVDERSEAAWLWLSAAVDDPADQLIALENVLVLNPQHAQALAGASALRAKLGLGPAPTLATAVAPTWTPPPDPAADHSPTLPRNDAFDAAIEDDPYQCAYCGRPAEPEAARCPHCQRSLLRPGLWRPGSGLNAALILAGLQTQSALVQAAGAYGYQNFPTFAARLPFGEVWAANLVLPAFVRTVLWAVVVVLLLVESRQSHRAALAVAAADMLWTGVVYGLGVVGPLLAIANALLSGLIGVAALAAVVGERQARVRLRVILDKNMHGADDVDRHAAAYARRSQWALAVIHWRRAIALRPRQPAYYKSLGLAQARLGRMDQALQAWRSGRELDPADGEFQRLIAQHSP